MSLRGEPIELWSEAMYGLIGLKARRSSLKGLGEYEDLFQEGCLGVRLHQLETGRASIDATTLFLILTTWMCRLNERRRASDALALKYEPVQRERLLNRPDPDAVLDAREAVGGLPPAQARYVEARYVEFRSIKELYDAWGRSKTNSRVQEANATLRRKLAGGYGPAEARKRAAPSKSRAAKRLSNRLRKTSPEQWSTWGPIPNQRDDD